MERWQQEIPGIEFIESVGRGGFGEVWKARQTAFNRPVAVKVTHAPVTNENLRKTFQRECHALGRLGGHQNIVQVISAGELSDHRQYIVFEYINGGTLGDWMEAGSTDELFLRNVVADIGSALEAAHSGSVLHRDIKPDNVFLRDSGQAVLGDFGIAQLADQTRTLTGAAPTGTICYMPPEVLGGSSRPSVAGDLYGLAATVWAAATGRPPFLQEGFGPAQIMYQVFNSELPPLTSFGYSTGLSDAVQAGLAKNPIDRPATVAEFVSLLDQGTPGAVAVSQPATVHAQIPPNLVAAQAPAEADPIFSARIDEQSDDRGFWSVPSIVGLGLLGLVVVAVGGFFLARAVADGSDGAAMLESDVAEPSTLSSSSSTSTSTQGSSTTTIAPDERIDVVTVRGGPRSAAVGGGKVWVPSGTEDAVTVIDASTASVIRTVDVGRTPDTGVATDRFFWVPNQGESSVTRLDIETGEVVDTIAVGEEPAPPVVAGDSVWVASFAGQSVTRIDANSGAVLATIDIGGQVSGATVADGSVWVSNIDEGSVVEIDVESGSIVQTVAVGATPFPARAAAGQLWVPNLGDGTVTQILLATGEVVRTIAVGSKPVTPVESAGSLWVSNFGAGTVSQINLDTGTVVATIKVGDAPTNPVAVGNTVWISNNESDDVTAIDATTGQVIETLPVGNQPRNAAADDESLWISNDGSGTVTKILHSQR